MKNKYILFLAFVGLLFGSCSQDEITFNNSTLDTDAYSEVRVLSVIPVSGTCDTLRFNNQNYSFVSTAAGNYIPLSTPKYLSVPIGTNSVTLHYNAKTTTPSKAAFTYQNSLTLASGKWSAYIYNADKAPVLLQDADSLPTTDAWADTVCFVRVANFFFQSDGVTPWGNVTLKMKKNIVGADWETVASDIPFGAQSDYYKYKLKNTASASPWSGTEQNVTWALFDSSGNQFQSFTSTTTAAKSVYSYTYSTGLTKGGAYTIYLNGKEGTSNKSDQIIQFSSLYRIR